MTNATEDADKSSGAASTSGPKEFDWFDRPQSRRLLWRLLYGACIVSVLLEIPLILSHKRHSHFESHENHGETAVHAATAAASHVPTFDGWWFFYAALGFVGCALMILAAKGLGMLLKRPEGYYADDLEEKTLPEDIDDAAR